MKNVVLKDFSIVMCILFGSAHVAADPPVDADRLRPCPTSPNCVSSLSNDEKHYIKPFVYRKSLENARKKLIDILENSRGVRLVSVEKHYLHAEFRSLIFRFVDDVEFYFPTDQAIIHVKSASRSGYYDFGANRRRAERLRSAFEGPAK
jgi:uncharacterized protein (DUF1499 family)